MGQPDGGKTTPGERELRNWTCWTPVALKWPFLLCLAIYVCGLLSTLEYVRRAFPTAEDRSIPGNTTSPFGPFISAPLTAVASTSATAGPPHTSVGPRHLLAQSSNATSVQTRSTSGPTTTADIPDSITLTAARPTTTSLGNSSAGPVQIGYRTAYPLSYLNHSKQPSTLRRRVQDPGHYGDLVGPIQKILFPESFPNGDDSLRANWIVYYAENTKASDLAAWNTWSPWDDLCRMRCDGPALVFIDDLCWTMWHLSASSQQLERQAFPDAVFTFGESEQGGVRCPLPEALRSYGPDPTVAEVDLVETATIDGAPTTTTKHTRIPLLPETVVVYGADGRPVATKTRPPRLQVTSMTFADENGQNTATLTAEIGLVPTVLTFSDAHGHPTATVTVAIPLGSGQPSHWQPAGGDNTPRYFHPVSWGSYICATFLPVLLSIPLSIVAQIINGQLKTVLPFHAMTRPGGATAADSLCMDTAGFAGVINSFRLLFRFGEPLSLLSDLITLSSAAIVSLSSAAVGIKLYGVCEADNSEGCYMGIVVFSVPSQIVEAILGVMLLSIALMYLSRKRGQAGVGPIPQNIAALASLLQDSRTRQLFRDIPPCTDGGHIRNRVMLEELDGYTFRLGCLPSDSPVTSPQSSTLFIAPLMGRIPAHSGSGPWGVNRRPPLRHLGYPFRTESAVRAVFFSILCGSFILIIYYESTRLDTPFERFMDNMEFGARALFCGLGVVTSFFWESHFSHISVLEPYRRLSRGAQPAGSSVLLTPSSSPFVGSIRSLARRDAVVATVAFITVLSKFTPIFLVNIPFSPFQTWTMAQACARLSECILALMILALALEWAFVRHPYMPVNPGTLAGRLYYICDSRMVYDFEEMAAVKEGRLGGRLSDCKKYKFGMMVGVSGEKRIGVDYADGEGSEILGGFHA